MKLKKIKDITKWTRSTLGDSWIDCYRDSGSRYLNASYAEDALIEFTDSGETICYSKSRNSGLPFINIKHFDKSVTLVLLDDKERITSKIFYSVSGKKIRLNYDPETGDILEVR